MLGVGGRMVVAFLMGEPVIYALCGYDWVLSGNRACGDGEFGGAIR